MKFLCAILLCFACTYCAGLSAATSVESSAELRIKKAVKEAHAESQLVVDSVKPARLFTEGCATSLARVNRAYERVTKATTGVIKMQTRESDLASNSTSDVSHVKMNDMLIQLLNDSLRATFEIGISLRNNVTNTCTNATTSYEQVQAGTVLALNYAYETNKQANLFSAASNKESQEECLRLAESEVQKTKQVKENVIKDAAMTQKMVNIALILAAQAEEKAAEMERRRFQTDQLLMKMKKEVTHEPNAMRTETNMQREGCRVESPLTLVALLFAVLLLL